MGWDCYGYTFIGVRIPQKRLWEKDFLKRCECYEENIYCEECSGEFLTFESGEVFKYGFEIHDNERLKDVLYICIHTNHHNCKDPKRIVKCDVSFEELIIKREQLQTLLIKEDLLTASEFQQWFGVYTRANYDY
jgi:hypothetical protein